LDGAVVWLIPDIFGWSWSGLADAGYFYVGAVFWLMLDIFRLEQWSCYAGA